MHHLQPLTKIIWAFVACLVIAGCAGLRPSTHPAPPLVPFEKGVAALSTRLLTTVAQDRQPGGGAETVNVMLIPFADADSEQVPEISRRVEAIFIATGHAKFKNFKLARLTYQNIAQADYLISGTIGLKAYPPGSEANGKHYQITGEACKRATASLVGQDLVWMVGQDLVWIADQKLNYRPTAIYRDSPLYLKGSRLQAPERSPDAPAGQYFDVSLKTMAIQIEGRMAYEKGDYEAARKLFRLAAERRDGQDLGTYAGLYLANHKLGRQAEADAAFRKVVAISVEKHRYLTVKYLFWVDSVDFLSEPGLKERYEVWLHHIGKYFQDTEHCLHIVGHASRTGTAEYNQQLSMERAEVVRKRLSSTSPAVYDRITIEGRGFSQNIVGTGTDDENDELDRRVELFIIECK